jgi:hypothetical protein
MRRERSAAWPQDKQGGRRRSDAANRTDSHPPTRPEKDSRRKGEDASVCRVTRASTSAAAALLYARARARPRPRGRGPHHREGERERETTAGVASPPPAPVSPSAERNLAAPPHPGLASCGPHTCVESLSGVRRTLFRASSCEIVCACFERRGELGGTVYFLKKLFLLRSCDCNIRNKPIYLDKFICKTTVNPNIVFSNLKINLSTQ